MRRQVQILTLGLGLLLAPTLAVAQSGTGPGCIPDVTRSTTGRVLLFATTSSSPSLTGLTATYYTTGGPATVQVQIEASQHNPVVGTEPMVKWGPFSDTGGTQTTDFTTAKGGFKFWWLNVTSLTGGTAPTVVVSTCFSSTDPTDAAFNQPVPNVNARITSPLGSGASSAAVRVTPGTSSLFQVDGASQTTAIQTTSPAGLFHVNGTNPNPANPIQLLSYTVSTGTNAWIVPSNTDLVSAFIDFGTATGTLVTEILFDSSQDPSATGAHWIDGTGLMSYTDNTTGNTTSGNMTADGSAHSYTFFLPPGAIAFRLRGSGIAVSTIAIKLAVSPGLMLPLIDIDGFGYTYMAGDDGGGLVVAARLAVTPGNTSAQVQQSATLANSPTSQTFTAVNAQGVGLVESRVRWSKVSNPGAGSQATASIAAEAAVRHVAKMVCFSAGSTTAPAATSLTVNLRDGATGAGTVIWAGAAVITASTGMNISNFCTPELNLVGTTNTAMTAEFSASLANLIQTVTLTGYNVN